MSNGFFTIAPSTIVNYPLNGQVEFIIPFEFLARKFVVATLIGATKKPLVMGTDYRFVAVNKIQLAAQPDGSFTNIELRRVTSAADRLVSFVDGSILRAYDLNIAQIQTIHIAEEARDLAGISLVENDEGNLDARGRRIVNVANGIDNGDAVNMSQLRQFDTSTANNADRAAVSAAAAKQSEINAEGSESRSVVAEAKSIASAGTAMTAASDANRSMVKTKEYSDHVDSLKSVIDSDAAKAQTLLTEAIDIANNVTSLINSRKNVKTFDIETGVDVTDKVQQAIDTISEEGGGILEFNSGVYIAREIVLKTGVILSGMGRGITVLQKPDGYNGRAVSTYLFDELDQKSDSLSDDRLPRRLGITNMTFNGRYLDKDWKEDNNTYVNTQGGGVFLCASELILDAEVLNQAGIGVYMNCKGAEVLQKHRRDKTVNLDIYTCKEECFVHKGAPDGLINKLFTACGGARIKSEWDLTPPSSPSYGSINGGLTDNIVMDGAGAEFDVIHTFGALSGRGLFTTGGPRMNIDLIIAESCRYGGIELTGTTYGIIDRVQLHGNGVGGDNQHPDFLDSSNGNTLIGNMFVYPSTSSDTSHNKVVLRGAFTTIRSLLVDAKGRAGHALVITGSYNSVSFKANNGAGMAIDGTPSCAYVRSTSSSSAFNDVDGVVINYPLVFKSEGTPLSEKVHIVGRVGSTSTVFTGDKKVNDGQHWDISVTSGSTTFGTQSFSNASFNPTITGVQTITTKHNLLYAPDISNIMATVYDSPTTISAFIGNIVIVSADDTNVVVQVMIETPQGANTTPRVSLLSKI